jgi:glycosyltransferase involved in cell wall biosynthesis
MITNQDIILTGIQSWDIEIGSNCKNIALEFAKNNRVLYVNAPLDRMTKWRNAADPLVKKRIDMLRTKADDVVKVSENLWNLFPRTTLESINGLPFKALFRYLNRINNKRFARQIKKAAKRLGFKDYILFTDSDMFRSFYLKELLSPKLLCYYTRDNLLAVPFWQKHGYDFEPALMAKSDLVCANSTYLATLAAKYNPYSFYVGQGCDLSLYDKTKLIAVPKDLIPIPKPIIGYTGALYALRLDVDILVLIAKTKPSWSLVLIGPEDDTFRCSELHQLSNVHFLGNKNPEELPAYINGFDVAINPQKLNEVTRGNYPRKIDEYLALGKPTVATKTEAMSIFAEHTYQATNAHEFVQLIDLALSENTLKKEAAREAFAREHSWENNVLAIYECMEQKIKAPCPI